MEWVISMTKCKLCTDKKGYKLYNGMCALCWKHADCCGLEKL